MDIRNKEYYQIAQKGSLDKTHPSFDLIAKYGSRAKRILDVGCGEGTRLSLINNKSAQKIGIDVSSIAISIAKKQYPSIEFKQVNGKLPFPDFSFDFVYSAFVLEHTENPESFLKEVIRVLSPNGILLLVAPNFGSPNRISPNGKSPRLEKLIHGLKDDLSLILAGKIRNLTWQKVIPQKTYSIIDADTTVEPYLFTLEKFLKNGGIKKISSSSLWDQEQGFSLFQLPFRVFGSLGLMPFSYWGPHILFVGKKHE